MKAIKYNDPADTADAKHHHGSGPHRDRCMSPFFGAWVAAGLVAAGLGVWMLVFKGFQ